MTFPEGPVMTTSEPGCVSQRKLEQMPDGMELEMELELDRVCGGVSHQHGW